MLTKCRTMVKTGFVLVTMFVCLGTVRGDDLKVPPDYGEILAPGSVPFSDNGDGRTFEYPVAPGEYRVHQASAIEREMYDVCVYAGDVAVLSHLEAMGCDLLEFSEGAYTTELSKAEIEALREMGLGVDVKGENPPEAPEEDGRSVSALEEGSYRAWVTIFEEDFEGSFPGSWIVGDSDSRNDLDCWDDASVRSFEGSWSGWCADVGDRPGGGYDDYMNAYMDYNAIDISGYSTVNLRFAYWLNTEPDLGYMSVFVKNSVDSAYTSLDHYTGTSDWQVAIFDVTSFGPTIDIRFFFYSDGSVSGLNGYEGVYIDAVVIEGKAATGSISGRTRVPNDNLFLSDVQLSLTGPVDVTTTSDANGHFSFSGLPAGTYTLTPSKWGHSFRPSSRSIAVASGAIDSMGFIGIPNGYAIVLSEDFEGVFPGSWDTGDANPDNGDDYWDNQSASNEARVWSGSWSGYCADESDIAGQQYDDNMNAYMERTGVDAGSLDSAYLFLMHWVYSEPVYDWMHVYVRRTGDADYEYLWSVSGGLVTDPWSGDVDDITGYGPTVDVKITFETDASVHDYEGAYVDEILIAGPRHVPPDVVAQFSGNPRSGQGPLTVQFTDQSTGDISSGYWSFGDGGTSTEQNPSHTYNEAGQFDVSLTVSGPGGSDSEAKASYITVTEPAPVADFSGNPRSGQGPLTVQFTDQSTGSITSWSWSFGDGGTSTEQSPSHTYDSAGQFDVSLTVSGPGGSDTEAKASYITVTEPAPVADFSGNPRSGQGPLTVMFTDQSTGSITSWSWSFGDGGTSTEQNPLHTYNEAGQFGVSLTVSGPGGSDSEAKVNYIAVTEPAPVADFGASPRSGPIPLTVQFMDLSTGSITSWFWIFGDGGTSTEQNPSHTYNEAGQFDVSLTVSGPGGSDTETKANYISDGPPAPVADFSASPRSGPIPLTVQFMNQSMGNVTNWLWDFGDGGTSTEQNPSHTYNEAGQFDVTLTASGLEGSDSETKADYVIVCAEEDIDQDGDIDEEDAGIILEVTVGLRPYDAECDLNQDGDVNAMDAIICLQAGS